MVPGAEMLVTGAAVVGNGAVWGLELGKYAAWGVYYSKRALKRIKPIIDRMHGLLPAPVKVTRQPDRDGKLVFVFDDVSIVDFDKIERQIRGTDAPDVGKKGAPNKIGPYYQVELVIDTKDVRLGEIDFSDWSRPDFQVTVTRKSEKESSEKILDPKVQEDKDEYDQVLATLKRFAKVSLDSTLTPNQIAAEKITEKKEGVIGFFQNWWNRIQGEVVDQKLYLDGSQHLRLQEASYVNDLIVLAVDKVEGDDSILENFYGAIEQSLQNDLIIVQKTREELQEELRIRERQRVNWWLILGAIAAAVAVVTAGLIALTVFFPTIGGPILGIVATIFSSTISIFGSKILAGVTSLSIACLAVGVVAKTIPEFSREQLRLCKADLQETKGNEKELLDKLQDVQKIKDELKEIIEQIKKIEIKPTLQLPSKKISSEAVAVICEYLGKDSCQLRKISLNTIKFKPKEIESLQQALAKNFSVIEFKYGDRCIAESGKEVPINKNIVDEINKQLLINRYLQGEEFAQFKEAEKELFQGGEGQIKRVVIEKIATNFEITKIPFKVRDGLSKGVNEVIEQNKLLLQTSQERQITAKEVVKVFKLNPSRCLTFWDVNRKWWLLGKLQHAIANDPLALKEMGKEECKQLLRKLEVQGATIELFASTIEQLPAEDKITKEFKEEISRTFKDILLNLEEYKDLDGTKFKEQIKALKTKIQELKVEDKDGVKESVVRAFDSVLSPGLSSIQYQLNSIVEDPKLSSELFSRFIKIFSQRGDEKIQFTPTQLERFKKLVEQDVYDNEKIVCAQLKSLNERDRQALLEIFFKDEKDDKNKAILVSRMIAEIFSLGEENQKDQFLVNFCNQELYHSFFGSSILWLQTTSSYDYAGLKTGLEEQRQKALRGGKTEIAKAIDLSLQTAYQAELIDKYKCLKEPSSKDGFEVLQEELKNSFNLRYFVFSETIDGEVKSYLNRVISRNRLYDAISNYQTLRTPKEKLERFVAIYSDVKVDKERQECLDEFMSIERPVSNGQPTSMPARELLKLVKDDAWKNNSEIFGKLDKVRRTELLEVCLKCDVSSPVAAADSKPHVIATMASELIELIKNNSLKLHDGNKPIWGVFGWSGWAYPHEKWSFAQYIEEFKNLRVSHSDIAEEIDKIINNALQESLIAGFDCLQGAQDHPMELSSFDKLKEELESNYDLMKFDSSKLNEKVKPEVREYIGSVCQRNLLKKYLEAANLEGFIDVYRTVPSGKERDMLLALDKGGEANKINRFKILEMLTRDLGKDTDLGCKKLCSLEEGARIELLTHCFTLEEEEQYAAKKAKLISDLLKINGLVDPAQNTKLVNEIKKLVYWGISVEGGRNIFNSRKGVPYYKYEEMEEELNGMLTKIPDTDESLREIKNGLKVALGVDGPAVVDIVNVEGPVGQPDPEGFYDAVDWSRGAEPTQEAPIPDSEDGEDRDDELPPVLKK